MEDGEDWASAAADGAMTLVCGPLPDAVATARRLLVKILTNLASDPANEKFRRLKTTNPKIQKLVGTPGVTRLLEAAGFKPAEAGLLVVTPDDHDLAGARAAVVLGLLTEKLPDDFKLSACFASTQSAAPPEVRAVAFVSSGGIASGSQDNVVRVFGPAAGGLAAAPLAELTGHDVIRQVQGITAVAGPVEEGDLLYSAGKDGRVIGWSVGTNSPTRASMIEAHTPIAGLTNAQVIADIAVLPGQQKIATASWDKTAAIWDVETGQRTALMPHEAAVLGLAALDDGSVVTACGDGKLRVFEPTGTLSKTLVGHRSPVRAVTALRKGPEQSSQPLASVDNSGALLLWDPAVNPAGAELKLTMARAHSSYLFCCNCNPTTGELLTAGDDSTVKVWSVETADGVWRIGLIQTIFVPGEVYDVAASPVTGDVLAASTDGVSDTVVRPN